MDLGRDRYGRRTVPSSPGHIQCTAVHCRPIIASQHCHNDYADDDDDDDDDDDVEAGDSHERKSDDC